MAPPNLTAADPNAFMRPQEWHEAINPFAAAYRGITPLATGQTTAMRPEDYDFIAAMREAQAQQAAARGGQMTNAEAILARALGKGTSLAELQLRDATDRGIQQMGGAVASIRGQNPALAQRQILNQGAAMQQQMAGQAALLRAQEQQQAQALAAQAFGAMRGQDQGMFGAAGQGRQAQNQLNVNADLQAQQQNLQRELANQQAIQRNQAMQYGSDQAAAQRNINTAAGIGQAAMGVGQIAMGMPPTAWGGGGDDGSGYTKRDAPGFGDIGWMGIDPGYTKGGYSGGMATPAGFVSANEGGVIPGVAKVAGDSPVNDTVPAMLAPGEVVIPRTKATPDGAYEFVKALKERSGEDDRMARIFELQDRLDRLKQGMAYGGVVGGKKGC